jgi:CheY-like chemotaxis protein
MNAVLGMTELLLHTPLTDRQRELAASAHRSGAALLDIINDILDLSSVEAGKLRLRIVEFDPRGLVDDVAALLQEAASGKGVELRWSVAPDVPSAVCGDPVRLRQILTNLLSNAVKFTERGTVSLDLVVVPGSGLRFVVRDTGIGIGEAAREHLFHPFWQADMTATRRFGGTGLGLAITHHLVTLMRGTIDVRSTPGTGTEFEVTLPLPLPDPARAELRSEEGRAAPPTQAARLGAHVLLAEDNPVNREVAVAMLASLGVTVDTVDNGSDAHRLARERRYDAILMDLQMPGLDGLEATRRIRADALPARDGRRDVPIIALTANAMTGDRDRCLAAGMDDHLPKPFARANLEAALRRWASPATTPA